MIHGDVVEDSRCNSCVGTGSTWEAVTGLERAVRMTTAPELGRSAQTSTFTLTQPKISTSQAATVLVYLFTVKAQTNELFKIKKGVTPTRLKG